MAQASSAQREPSMEEILASIRRIIEDNDSGRRPAVDFEQMRPEPEGERSDRNVIEVEAFRAEFQSGKASPGEAMPDVDGLKAGITERDDVDAVAFASLEPTKSADLGASAPAVETPATPRPVAASWAPVSTAAVEKMERLAGPAPEPQKIEPPVATAPAEPVAIAPVELDHVEDAPGVKPAIISEQAGRQVSAAFGELSDAYAARSRKSFDDIAAEMMRPMLQDWLDNNLPTLVEKLVREEIERVARGAQ